MKLRNIYDILQTKLVKRGLSIRILDAQGIENALGGRVRQVYNLKKGLTQELAKKIAADIKDSKIKVQTSIQGDKLRVSGKDKDDLQAVIKMLRGNEEKYDYPLQFNNSPVKSSKFNPIICWLSGKVITCPSLSY